jgi:hypothetical protein
MFRHLPSVHQIAVGLLDGARRSQKGGKTSHG